MDIHVIYLHMKFHFPSCNALLIVVIKLKITHRYHMADMSEACMAVVWVLFIAGN
jgi:hypothetical protein